MGIDTVKWPDSKRFCAMISINLDAEFFGRIYYPDIDVTQGDIFRLGRTGMRFGLPKLLDVLDSYEIKAVFFVPGAVAKLYPREIAAIAGRGHEIGCHGNNHEILAHMSREEQEKALTEATEILSGAAGKPVKGFRMPEGEINKDTYRVLEALGYSYSSSLSDDDVPYRREETGILELPIHWELFDLPYFVFTFDPPIPPGQSRSASMDHVLSNWMYELEGARRWGTLLNLQLDPQAVGEQGRIFMLERFLEALKEGGDVWIATGQEIAEYFNGQEEYLWQKQH